MGDRSPKDKQKHKKQHEHDNKQKQAQKQENMIKNRNSQAPDAQGETPYKKAG